MMADHSRWKVALAVLLLTGALAGPAVAEPLGFVIEAVLAAPEADSPLELDTAIDVEDGGYILVITNSGNVLRQDGPYHDRAENLFATDQEPGGGDLGNGILSSLLELAEVSRKSTEQLGGVRGIERGHDASTDAITPATRTFCFVAGEAPGFYTSTPPQRDEPVIMRLRTAPRGFFQTTWPVGKNFLPWPGHWPAPKEGRYIWTFGSKGPSPLWLRSVKDRPQAPARRAALYYDMRCYTQAIALIRTILDDAARP